MNKYTNSMMKTAYIFAKESYATRLKVGAVLEKDGRILLTGYNGTISKTNNNCEITCKVCNGEGHVYETAQNDHSLVGEKQICPRCQGAGKTTSPFVLHAEQNIITWAAKKGIATEGTTLYVTHSPCEECSKFIAQCGIVKVFFNEYYRDTSGIDFLKGLGIIVEKTEVEI